MIYIIEINELLSNLKTRQVLTTRVKASDQEATDMANSLLTTWLHANPGRCASWSMTGASARQRGITN